MNNQNKRANINKVLNDWGIHVSQGLHQLTMGLMSEYGKTFHLGPTNNIATYHWEQTRYKTTHVDLKSFSQPKEGVLELYLQCGDENVVFVCHNQTGTMPGAVKTESGFKLPEDKYSFFSLDYSHS